MFKKIFYWFLLMFLFISKTFWNELEVASYWYYNDLVDFHYINDDLYNVFTYKRISPTDKRFFKPRYLNQWGVYSHVSNDNPWNYEFGSFYYPNRKYYIKLENWNILTIFTVGVWYKGPKTVLWYYDYFDNTMTYQNLQVGWESNPNLWISFINNFLFIRSDNWKYCQLNFQSPDKNELCVEYNETVFNHYISLPNWVNIINPIYNISNEDYSFFMLSPDKKVLKSYNSSLEYWWQINISNTVSVWTGIINNFTVFSDNFDQSIISIYNDWWYWFYSISLNNGVVSEFEDLYITQCDFNSWVCYFLEESVLWTFDFSKNLFSDADDTFLSLSMPFYSVNKNWKTDYYYFRDRTFYVFSSEDIFSSSSTISPSNIWNTNSSGSVAWSWSVEYLQNEMVHIWFWENSCVGSDYEWYFWGFYKFGCYIKNFFNSVINGFKWVYNWFLDFINAFWSFTDVEHKNFTSFFFNSAYADNSESQIINIMTSWSFEDNSLLNNIFNFIKWFLVFTAFLSVYFMFFNPNSK